MLAMDVGGNSNKPDKLHADGMKGRFKLESAIRLSRMDGSSHTHSSHFLNHGSFSPSRRLHTQPRGTFTVGCYSGSGYSRKLRPYTTIHPAGPRIRNAMESARNGVTKVFTARAENLHLSSSIRPMP